MLMLVACSAEPPPVLELAGRHFANERLDIAFDVQRLAAWNGCNEMDADYTLDGERLVVANASDNGELCTPEGAQEAAAFFALLQSMPALALDGHELTVEGASTTLVLVER
jgi:heat shock protein HslJ